MAGKEKKKKMAKKKEKRKNLNVTCIRAEIRTSSDVLERNTHPPLPVAFSTYRERERASARASEREREEVKKSK